MKKCPYCAEEIQDEAIKCKYCGEMLSKQENIFSYRAKDSQGKYIVGTIEAFNHDDALNKLEAKGLKVIYIKVIELEIAPPLPIPRPSSQNKTPVHRIKRGWLIFASIMIVAAIWINLTNPYKRTNPVQITKDVNEIIYPVIDEKASDAPVKDREERPELSEQQRKQIWVEIIKAEDDSLAQAEKSYPYDLEAMKGKSREEIKMQMDRQYYTQAELRKKYKDNVADKYNLTEEQLEEITLEGLNKNWEMFPR